MTIHENPTPVTVIVTEDRYDIIDEPTLRNQYLARVLMEMGGVNESVPPGTYKFNVVPGDNGMIVTLTSA